MDQAKIATLITTTAAEIDRLADVPLHEQRGAAFDEIAADLADRVSGGTRDQIARQINELCDEWVDDEPDTGLRDAMNLLVNAVLYRIDTPAASLTQVADAEYQATPLSVILDWIDS